MGEEVAVSLFGPVDRKAIPGTPIGTKRAVESVIEWTRMELDPSGPGFCGARNIVSHLMHQQKINKSSASQASVHFDASDVHAVLEGVVIGHIEVQLIF